jgi:hypothetical protein
MAWVTLDSILLDEFLGDVEGVEVDLVFPGGLLLGLDHDLDAIDGLNDRGSDAAGDRPYYEGFDEGHNKTLLLFLLIPS